MLNNLAKEFLNDFSVEVTPKVYINNRDFITKLFKNKNKNTLTNSIYNSFLNNKKVIVWKDSVRNLIDIDDINKILEKYFKKYNYKSSNKKIINIFFQSSIRIAIGWRAIFFCNILDFNFFNF